LAVEIAPGPARVSVDVVPALKRATLIDASAEMLAEAGRRLDERGLRARATLVRADAFNLPLRETVDLVYTFRLIRHFDRTDRLRLYREVASVLRPGGWLLFDAVNRVVSAPLRAAAKPGEFQHFDALLTPEELRDELGECGFSVTSLQGVQHRASVLGLCQIYLGPRSRRLSRLAMEIVDRTGGQPLEWVVTCRRE
jgi:SAM-dependent methyltransferase